MKKKVVLIGGGHGLSNIVKGFKDEDIDLSIIVASTDDGGHTGKIRSEFKTVAVGDLRMVLNELIDEKSSLKDIFEYRFNSLHGISKVSLGNLMITSLWMKYNDIDKVIRYFKERENIKSNIFLSSNNPLILCAKCENGEIIEHECLIGKCNKKISELYSNNKAICNETMLEKIREADIIVLCPGSLYTSIGAVLCIDEIKMAICDSMASIVYVCNMMTEKGETENFTVNDHVVALENIMNKSIDRVIVNNGKIEDEILEKYDKEGSKIVAFDEILENYELYDLVEIVDGKVKHNAKLTKKIILRQ